MRLTLSLPFSFPFLFLSHSLPSFLPPLLSRHSLIPRSLPSRSKSNSRRVELTGRGPAHRPKSILGRRRESGNDDRAKEKDVIQITNRPGLSLWSPLYWEGSLLSDRRRSRLVSSGPFSLPFWKPTLVIVEEDAPKRVSMHSDFPELMLQDRPKLGSSMR